MNIQLNTWKHTIKYITAKKKGHRTVASTKKQKTKIKKKSDSPILSERPQKNKKSQGLLIHYV